VPPPTNGSATQPKAVWRTFVLHPCCNRNKSKQRLSSQSNDDHDDHESEDDTSSSSSSYVSSDSSSGEWLNIKAWHDRDDGNMSLSSISSNSDVTDDDSIEQRVYESYSAPCAYYHYDHDDDDDLRTVSISNDKLCMRRDESNVTAETIGMDNDDSSTCSGES
jgi:hypothetical protein